MTLQSLCVVQMEPVVHVKQMLMELEELELVVEEQTEQWERVKQPTHFVARTARVMLVVIVRKNWTDTFLRTIELNISFHKIEY